VAKEKMPLRHKNTKIHKKSSRHILIQYIVIHMPKIQIFIFHFSKANYLWKIAESIRDGSIFNPAATELATLSQHDAR